jgi:hypothetical protein
MAGGTIWHQAEGWTLEAWGNGLSLEVRHEDGRSVFVQGDDAEEMRDQWEALERMYGDVPTGELLKRLWDMHS